MKIEIEIKSQEVARTLAITNNKAIAFLDTNKEEIADNLTDKYKGFLMNEIISIYQTSQK
jgi:predicted glycosyltransferase